MRASDQLKYSSDSFVFQTWETGVYSELHIYVYLLVSEDVTPNQAAA